MAVSSTSGSYDSLKDMQTDRDSNMGVLDKDLKKVHSSGALSLMAMESASSSLGISTHSAEKDG